MDAAQALLSVDNVSKRFPDGNLALEQVTFAVGKGEFVCVLGKSGVGKSTLLNVIAGIEEISSGEIHFSSTISYAPQRDYLLPWRTALENVLLPLELRREVSEANVQRAVQLFSEVGLSAVLNRHPETLSGGMKQRVSLIRALVQRAALVLFDEPFSANDAHTRLSLAKTVRSLIKCEARSAIFVTHSIEEAMALADRVLTLGGSPARIRHEVRIDLGDEFRDPVSVRNWGRYGEVFRELWCSLEDL